MKRYLIKQLLMIPLTLLLVTAIAFGLIRLMPADPVDMYLLTHHMEKSDENVERAKEMFGLNEPVTAQYLNWLGDVITLNFGKAYSNGQEVAPMLGNALAKTLQLALASMVWVVIATPILGIGASKKPGGIFDKLTGIYCLCGTAVPTFVLGFVLIRFFAVRLKWVPAVSDGSLVSLILPSFTLSLSHTAYFVQMLRNGMLENRGRMFVDYARARGIGEKTIFRTHLLRNSLQPLVNTMGISIGGLIAGTVIIENVFSWPGLGRLITRAILARDYPVIQGYILIVAVTYICANTVSDLVSVLVDPRIRLGKDNIS